MPSFVSTALYYLMIASKAVVIIVFLIYVLLVLVAGALYAVFWFWPKLFLKMHRLEDQEVLAQLMQAQRLMSECSRLIKRRDKVEADLIGKDLADRDEVRLREATAVRDRLLAACQQKFNPETIRVALRLSRSYFF